MAILVMRRWRRLAAATVVGLLAVPLWAQAPAPLEPQLKAVFLFNFTKYVTWKTASMASSPKDEVRVCITADDGLFAMLKATLQDEDLDGRPLVAVALDGLDAARSCHILYVGNAQTADARAWFTAVRGSSVLTVGDGAVSDEPVIAFVRDQNRLRFDINRVAATQHHLTISSKLLRLARQVKEN